LTAILNELRHISECFWVALRHRDRDAGLLKTAIVNVRAGEFRDERRQRIADAFALGRLTRASLEQHSAFPAFAFGYGCIISAALPPWRLP